MISPASPYQLKASPFSSHGRILSYLAGRPKTLRILDVGTAQGYLGRALKEAGFTRLVGLEKDPVYAEAARPAYTKLIEHDLDALETCPLQGPFDLILCADVLEHLKDPRKALNTLARLLNPGGNLILSVPNSGHWWMRLNVLVGRFPKEERGLFDRGHLQFFTWATLRDLVNQSGLGIEQVWITPVPFSVSFGDKNGLALWLEGAYSAFSHLWKRLFAYQFILCTTVRTK